MKVGVLGGGISGLSSGYFLKQKGIDFEVIEAEKGCGGLCKSVSENGFTFDVCGGHIFFTKDKEVMDLVLELLGDNKIKQRRNTKILFKNKLVKYPFENGLSDLPKEDNFECLYEFIKTINQNHEKPRNFREWIMQTFGKGIADRYMIPYNTKIWKYPPEKLATFWVDGRVPKPPVEDIIKSSIGIETEGYTHQLYFWYPLKGGFQAITDAFEDKISGNVAKGFRITSIKRAGNKWHVFSGEEEKSFDRIISTIPLQDMPEVMELPENVRDAIRNLKYNSIVILLIGIDNDERLDRTWLYIPQMDVLTHRTINLKNYSVYTSPHGKSSIISEVTFREGDEISRMPDEQVMDRVIDDLDRIGILDKNEVCFRKAVRTKYAYVVYDIDYERNIKIVRDYFDSVGIELVGRFAEFKYYNSDGCIRAAKDAVERIF